MISKNLFFNLMREDIKRRIWSIALSTLVFMIILPIFCSLTLSNSDYQILEEWEIKELINIIGPSYEILIIVTIICAVVCGLSGFFYLHSRKKVDLYHSIPVRREQVFFISYFNGLLIYMIPYFVNLFLCILILKVNGYLRPEIFTAAFVGFGINLLFFCLIYTLTIIAVMLTGNLIISFCGISVFLLYSPFVKLLKDVYFRKFFSTYFSSPGSDSEYSFLSPIGAYLAITEKYDVGMNYINSLITVVIITFLLIGFALFLYKKRPSEAAGKAMAFKVSKPIIKFLLMIPIALGGGMVLRNGVTYGHDVWFIFGIIFCFIIGYAIIQVVYEFDIKSAFHHKRQMLVCAVAIALIASVFRFDLLGYDNYLPKAKDMKSISVSITGFNQNYDSYEFSHGEINYVDYLEYELKHMELTDMTAAYEMARLGMESDIDRQAGYEYHDDYLENNIFTGYIKYSLKNGREIYRQYRFSLDDSEMLLKNIFSLQAYKKAHYPIYACPEDKITQINAAYGTELLNYESAGIDSKENINYTLEGESVKELLQIYKEELLTLTLEEIANEQPVVELDFSGDEISYRSYDVYPSFVKTLDFLEEHGFDITKELDPEKISEIIIYSYEPMRSESQELRESTVEARIWLSYTEQSDILKILPELLSSDYYHNNSTVIQKENDINVEVIYELGENGTSQSYSYLFRKNQVPDIVKEDIASSVK